MANKQSVMMKIMVAVIIILVAVIVYAFLIRPGITGFVALKQTEGYNYCFGVITENIVTQIQQNGFVQFPIGNETLYMRPFNPQQQ